MQNYDPYLNTYNYPYNTSEPYSLASDGDNQMPDSGYEDSGYDDPYMSYGNAYDNDGAQYSFKQGGSVGDENLPKLADLIRRHGNKYAELNLPILEASLRGITVNFPSDRPAAY